MNIFIDIIGSWFVRASMIVVALTLVVNMNNALYERATKANARALHAVVDSVIYADLSSACYDIDSSLWRSDKTFVEAKPTEMKFWVDTSSSTSSYTVKYYCDYPNSAGRYSLYRRVNNLPALLLGKKFTQVGFKYYTAAGDSIVGSPYSNIRRVRVFLGSVAENLGAPDSTISSDFTVFPSRLF